MELLGAAASAAAGLAPQLLAPGASGAAGAFEAGLGLLRRLQAAAAAVGELLGWQHGALLDSGQV